MLHHYMEIILPEIISIFEIVGIAVIVLGSAYAMGRHIRKIFTRGDSHVKIELGQALSLGLEFKMGAEILKTVLIRDLMEIAILGAIIILRAILAFMIHLEIKAEVEEDRLEGRTHGV